MIPTPSNTAPVNTAQAFTAARRQRGAILLMLLSLIGAGFLVTAGILSSEVMPRDERLAMATERVDALSRAATEAYRATGAWPADLPSLVAAGTAPSHHLLSADPCRAGFDIGYTITPGVGVSLRSAGADGRAGNADDILGSAAVQSPGRAPTRNRLSLLRSAFLLSGYMDDPAMTPGERAAMRDAVRDWSLARRAYVFADSAGQATLQSQMNAAETTITNLRTTYALPAIPSNATGAGGLLQNLGLPDSLGADGFGTTFETGLTGFVSRGADGVAGTDDDQ